jgi:mersacidin/lichenicidin family type 2 lantibiotic
MNFDIIRAWKDEAYRQNLSQEDLDSLPAHPAGDLSDSELAMVNGGEYGYGVYGASSSSSSAHATEARIHSYSFICDVNLFSLNVLHSLIGISLINVLSPDRQTCVNSD